MKIFLILDRIEVKLGDEVNINGFNLIITQEVIDKNPEYFEVVEEFPEYVKAKVDVARTVKGRIYRTFTAPENPYGWYDEEDEDSVNELKHFWDFFTPSTKEEFEVQQMLDKAKADYPIGTKFIDAHVNPEKGVNVVSKYVYHFDDKYNFEGIIGGANNRNYNVFIWSKARGWAEKVMPLFTTEDGVDVYRGDLTYAVHKEALKFLDQSSNLYSGDSQSLVYFSSKTAALEYIEKNSVKTLVDYESKLFQNASFYSMFKTREPKLYYIKILQLIADDLNDGEKFNWCDEGDDSAYIIAKINGGDLAVHSFNRTNYGGVCFKSEELAWKAIKIMGDKINLIF